MSKYLILITGTVSSTMDNSFPIAAKTLTDVLRQFGHSVDSAELHYDPESHTVTGSTRALNLHLSDPDFIDLLEKMGISVLDASREISEMNSGRPATPVPVYSQESQEPASDIIEAAGRSSIAEDIAKG